MTLPTFRAAAGVQLAAASFRALSSVSVAAQLSDPVGVAVASHVGGSGSVSGFGSLTWSGTVPVGAACRSLISVSGVALAGASSVFWGKPVALEDLAALSVALSGQELQRYWSIEVHQPWANDKGSVCPQLGVARYSLRPSEYELRQSELFSSGSGDFNLVSGPYLPSGLFEFGTYRQTDLPAQPLISSVSIAARTPPPKDAGTELLWGVGESLYYAPDLPYLVEPPLIDGGYIPDPNDQKVHLIVNSVDVVSLPDNTPLAVADVQIDLDVDSLSWRLSCDVLNDASIALVKPGPSGNKEIAITINGHRWVFFVASYGRGRSVSGTQLNKRFAITGYSRSQYLGRPYAPLRTRSIGSTSAVQAVAGELTGTGFSADWNVTDLPDWTLPNASFSYQGQSALQVIKRLAGAAGAVVQPALDEDVLTVRPRYSPAPWDLESSEMDRTVHESQILSEGGQLEYRELINAVFVSGESEGVAASVSRLGTAGDKPGPDIIDAWCTELAANQSRGRQEIAASGDRVIHTLELAIPEGAGQPGLLVPGLTVAVVYDDPEQTYRGYVTGVSVTVPGRGQAMVRQTVTIEQPVGWEML